MEGSRREEEHPEVPQEDEPVETPGLDGDRPKRVSQLTAARKHNNGKHFRNQRFQFCQFEDMIAYSFKLIYCIYFVISRNNVVNIFVNMSVGDFEENNQFLERSSIGLLTYLL